jgi:hypothetical protein
MLGRDVLALGVASASKFDPRSMVYADFAAAPALISDCEVSDRRPGTIRNRRFRPLFIRSECSILYRLPLSMGADSYEDVGHEASRNQENADVKSRSVPAIRPRRSPLGAPIYNRQRKKGAARTSSPLDASGVTEREHCNRHRQSARAQGPVSPPQLAASSGGQHGHDDTSDHPHHRAHCFRWRLVRPGTLVLEADLISAATVLLSDLEEGGFDT